MYDGGQQYKQASTLSYSVPLSLTSNEYWLVLLITLNYQNKQTSKQLIQYLNKEK